MVTTPTRRYHAPLASHPHDRARPDPRWYPRCRGTVTVHTELTGSHVRPNPPTGGDVRWQLADGLLGNSIPGLSVDTTPPIAWAGRFWAIETDTVASPNGDWQGRVTWHDPAIWWSGDGKVWTRRALPSGMTGQLSLVPWATGLAIYDWRDAPEPAGLRFLVWSSADGLHWHRQGGLDLRPTGDLRGCGFLDTYLESAGDRFVVSANCAVLHGAGGEVNPGFRTVASAASATTQGIPTHTWTSRDEQIAGPATGCPSRWPTGMASSCS